MPTKGRAGAPQVVVDGSNVATEGRSTPSLEQLEEAVTEVRREFPDAQVTVVVDATFSHRIPESERERFEAGVASRDYVQPPAGAIGRGDAFLLRIAERVDATVLSNDSFQEFHAEHPWLFDRGRLIGATPVPGIGWIFSQRKPVRGPLSRRTVRDANRSNAKVEKAIAAATKEVVSPKPEREADAGRHRRAAAATTQTVNAPLTFISFVAEHPLGTRLVGEVESFTSHGAVVHVGDMRCYVPLSGLGDPPPRSARTVLRRLEEREFVLTALDPQRRGVELALPDAAVVSGKPSEETVKAELRMAKPRTAQRVATPAKLVLATVAAGGNGSHADGSLTVAAGEQAGADGGTKARAGRPRRNANRAKAAAAGAAASPEEPAGTVAPAEASKAPAATARKAPARAKKAGAAAKAEKTPVAAKTTTAEKAPAVSTLETAPAVPTADTSPAVPTPEKAPKAKPEKAPAVKGAKAPVAAKTTRAAGAEKASKATKAAAGAKKSGTKELAAAAAPGESPSGSGPRKAPTSAAKGTKAPAAVKKAARAAAAKPAKVPAARKASS